MSNAEAAAKEDIRYTERPFPASLGEDPTEEAVKGFFTDYGWIYLKQIINNSSHQLKYCNPYSGATGYIQPGNSDSDKCSGYIPLWDAPSRYKITYDNTTFKRDVVLTIKDLDDNWLLSFEEGSDFEDIREFRPHTYDLKSYFELTLTDTGYEIYSNTWDLVITKLSWN